MKVGKILWPLIVVLIAIVIYINKCNKPEGTDRGAGKKQALMASAVIVKPQDIEDKIYSTGTLLANEEVDIRNELPGRITGILFKEGTSVKKGELLVTLYDEDLKAQEKKLQSQLEVGQTTARRQKDLLDIQGISQQEYDLAMNDVQSLQAELDIVKSNIDKTRIRAPFDGIIGLKTVSEGAYLPANTLIASMQSLEPMKLDFSIPEKYRAQVEPRTEVTFTTESSEGKYSGTIYAFEPRVDLQTRSILVRALCPNKEHKLIPGAFARIEIPLRKIEGALMIPTQSVIPQLKGQSTFLVKNGMAASVPIETGIRNDSTIQVTAGLQVGDTVLVNGIMQARTGMPVQVTIQN